MSADPAPTASWVVSTHTSGEVLIARASGPDLELLLLGSPPGFTQDELEGWLRDVAGVARETAALDSKPKPVPPVLHHALTGLLFSHAELWSPASSRPLCSMVFARGNGEVGLGWIGEAEVAVALEGRPLEVGWVKVRDDQGREAQAWAIEDGHPLSVQLVWRPATEGSGPIVVQVSAEWCDAESASITTEEAFATPEHLPFAIAASSTETEHTEEPEPATQGSIHARELPSTGIARWLDRNFSWHPGMKEEKHADAPFAPASIESAREAAVSDVVPPSPEPLELTERAAPSAPPRWPDLGPVQPVGRMGPPIEDPHARPALADVGPRSQPADPHEIRELSLGPSLARPGPETAREGFESPALSFGGAMTPTSEPEDAVEVVHEVEPTRAPEPNRAPEPMRGPEPVRAPRPAPAEPIAPVPGVFERIPSAPLSGHPSHSGVPAEPRRPSWPEPEDSSRPVLPWWRHWKWAVGFLLLFGLGWMLAGSLVDRPATGPRRGVNAWLAAIGITGPQFTLEVNSQPEGAAISIDGAPLELRTPASLELPAGNHEVTLSFGSYGSTKQSVSGAKDEQKRIDASLWGSLEVALPDPNAVVTVSVDGVSRGFAPLEIEELSPGPHEVRFSGPGMASWGQTVEIRVGEKREIFTRPLQSPATGLIQVRANFTDESGTESVSGARVWIDGAPRGETPLTVELPRGPHSFRVEFRKERAPIQVIDLPGGNQRFATFELGLHEQAPSLRLNAPARIPTDRPAVISGSLQNAEGGEVKEMWLHVRTPEGPWRRHAMTLIPSPEHTVGTLVFPAALLGSQGKTLYYLSAITQQGDEHFTEIIVAQAER